MSKNFVKNIFSQPFYWMFNICSDQRIQMFYKISEQAWRTWYDLWIQWGTTISFNYILPNRRNCVSSKNLWCKSVKGGLLPEGILILVWSSIRLNQTTVWQLGHLNFPANLSTVFAEGYRCSKSQLQNPTQQIQCLTHKGKI